MKLGKVYCSVHDKIDLAVMLVTGADIVWLMCDALHSFKLYHLPVGGLLLIGFLVSGKLTLDLVLRHHGRAIEVRARAARENSYLPQIKQSET